jgi:NADH dehydrogenase
MILVVGATGQLGTAVVRKLETTQRPVRAFVRKRSNYQRLQSPGVELAFGDLRDADSVDTACRGIDIVIATANAVIRPNGDGFASVSGDGYHNLISLCQQHGIKQFIYASTPSWPVDAKVPALKYKRLNEKRLQESNLNYTIVRASVFMDVWLSLIGSSIPTRGTEAATVKRPFWFSRLYMGGVGTIVEERGWAIIPGSGKTRHAFITVNDVARFLVGCIGHPEADRAIFHVGGPQAYSWDEAVDIFGRALGKRVRPIHIPAGITRLNRALFAPFAEGVSNIMGMLWAVGSYDSAYDTTDAYRILRGPMTTMQELLAEKTKLSVDN